MLDDSQTQPSSWWTLPSISFAGDFVVKSGWVLGPRDIPEFELVYFPHVECTKYIVNGQPYSLSGSCLVVTPPALLHQYQFNPYKPTRHLFVHFSFPGIDPKHCSSVDGTGETASMSHFFAELKRMAHHSPVVPVPETSILPSLLRQILFLAHQRPKGWHFRTHQLLFTVLGEILLLPESSEEAMGLGVPRQVSTVVEYIAEHLSEPISVQTLSGLTGWTHPHFTRVFAKHMGVSPKTYLLERRLSRACDLLVHSHQSIKEIAFQTGFDDEHYFSRMFKKAHGVPASIFRERNRDPRLQHVAAVDQSSSYPVNRYLFFQA